MNSIYSNPNSLINKINEMNESELKIFKNIIAKELFKQLWFVLILKIGINLIIHLGIPFIFKTKIRLFI